MRIIIIYGDKRESQVEFCSFFQPGVPIVTPHEDTSTLQNSEPMQMMTIMMLITRWNAIPRIFYRVDQKNCDSHRKSIVRDMSQTFWTHRYVFNPFFDARKPELVRLHTFKFMRRKVIFGKQDRKFAAFKKLRLTNSLGSQIFDLSATCRAIPILRATHQRGLRG